METPRERYSEMIQNELQRAEEWAVKIQQNLDQGDDHPFSKQSLGIYQAQYKDCLRHVGEWVWELYRLGEMSVVIAVDDDFINSNREPVPYD